MEVSSFWCQHGVSLGIVPQVDIYSFRNGDTWPTNAL